MAKGEDVFAFQSGSGARDPYLLERDLEDALAGAGAAFAREHNADGTHGPLGSLEVTGDTALNGRTEMNGALLVSKAAENDGIHSAVLTATTHDLAQPDGRGFDRLILKLSASAPQTVTGILPYAYDKYQKLVLMNSGNTTITLAHNDSGSVELNRMALPFGIGYGLLSGAVLELWYDSGGEVWRTEGIPTVMKLIQRGTITYASGSKTGSATITAVDMDKSWVNNLGTSYTAAAPNPQSILSRLTLTNSTTVSAERSTANDTGGNPIGGTVSFEVVEYF